jgi:uncharacterized protein
MSVVQDLVGVVERMFDCLGRGDIETVRREIFAADIVWVVPGRHPLSGTMYGADAVLTFFRQISGADLKIVLLGTSQFPGNAVVVFLRDVTSHGPQPDFVSCLRFQFENGKVKHVQIYVDNQYAADNYFNATFKLKPIPDRLAL